MLLERLHGVGLRLREARHRLEAEVTDVSLADRDETAEQVDRLRQQLGGVAEANATGWNPT